MQHEKKSEPVKAPAQPKPADESLELKLLREMNKKLVGFCALHVKALQLIEDSASKPNAGLTEALDTLIGIESAAQKALRAMPEDVLDAQSAQDQLNLYARALAVGAVRGKDNDIADKILQLAGKLKI